MTNATQPQIDRIERTLDHHQLHGDHFDRLWKLLETHRIWMGDPADGAPLPIGQASQIIDWLTRQGYQPPAREHTPLPTVPDGYYAVRTLTGSNEIDFFSVTTVTKTDGKWAGRTFTNVTRVIGGRSDTRIHRDEVRKVLDTITAEGVETARDLYAEQIGNCWKCNIHLTDDLSRELLIGPDCCKQVHGMTQAAYKAQRLALAS